jgi:hypothetical protein
LAIDPRAVTRVAREAKAAIANFMIAFGGWVQVCYERVCIGMSLGTSEHQCSKRVKEGKETNELLTERVKTVNTTNDGVCVCERRVMNMFADLDLIHIPFLQLSIPVNWSSPSIYPENLRFMIIVLEGAKSTKT